MTTQKFKPTAIPLLTTDPYFSLWNFSGELATDYTRHWTGHSQSSCGMLIIDGVPYRFMGLNALNSEKYFPEGNMLRQTSVKVTPTSSVFTFSHPACTLKVTFLSPLLLSRPEVFSRPVSYLFYEIKPKEAGHTFRVYVDFSAELSGDQVGKDYHATELPGHVFVGREEQNVLNRSGDDVRIDWGYLHLVHPNAKVHTWKYRRNFIKVPGSRNRKVDFDDLSKPLPCGDELPILCAESEQLKDLFVIAYDDIHSIEFFRQPADAYYKSVYGSFDEMLEVAVEEAEDLRRECRKFDRDLMAKMTEISPEYASVGSLAYRQAVAAHKLISVNGELMFLSKENFSNGCIATLDVTYPSIPLFLLFNPELARAMLRPLLMYASSPAWPYRYAPHDCGTYPLCNGQKYSTHDGVLVEDGQMPVEECGNAILTVAASVKADGNRAMAEQYHSLFRQWADYLTEYGYDPEKQLCTDDFAGHLAHNCNLSLKAIVALGAYAQLYSEPKYMEIAKDMANRWTKDAKKQNGKGWRLTFDLEDSWSLKYNMIWDRLLRLNLFDPNVGNEEIDVYLQKMNAYGVPLDSRADYTKLDWLAWTTVLADREDYTRAVYRAIYNMVCASQDRVPLTDWYYTSDARQRGFQARSVVGGFFINLLHWKK